MSVCAKYAKIGLKYHQFEPEFIFTARSLAENPQCQCSSLANSGELKKRMKKKNISDDKTRVISGLNVAEEERNSDFRGDATEEPIREWAS